MPKKPLSPAVLKARHRLADLIRAGMERGQTGDGTEARFWTAWNYTKLGERLGKAPNTIKNWCLPDSPMPPETIDPLCEVFYGRNSRFKDERAHLTTAWRQATGRERCEEDEGQRPVVDQGGHWVDALAELSLHPERIGHDPEIWRIDATFVISVSEPHEVWIDNKRREVSVGLTEATLRLSAAGFDVVPGSMAGGKGRENNNLRRVSKGIKAIGPLNAFCQRIDGEPLQDSHLASLVRSSGAVPEDAVTLQTVDLQVDRRAFRVLDRDHQPVTRDDNKEMILNQLLAEKFGGNASLMTLASRILDLMPKA